MSDPYKLTKNILKQQLPQYLDEACKELNVDSSNITFRFEYNRERFRTCMNAAEMDDTVMYINEEWLDYVLSIKDTYDPMFLMAHEARHIYQKQVIDDYKQRGRSCELPNIVQGWINNISCYIRNEGGDSQAVNASQSIEIDANAFACVYLLYKKNLMPRISPSCEKEVLKRMKEIGHKLWKITISEQ